MKTMFSFLMTLLFLVMLVVVGSAQTISASPVPTPSNDVEQSLAAFRGKIVILTFWTTWCEPCRFEIPGFKNLQNQYRDLGLEIVGVSLDPLVPRGEPAGAPVVAPFIKSYGINYHVLMVDKPSALAGYDLTRGIPITYVLDREGRVVKTHVSPTPMAVFEKERVAMTRIQATPMSEFEEDIRQLLSQHSKTECEPLVSTQAIDPAGQEFDVGMKMLNCIRQEGVKRVGAHPLSPVGDRYVFVGEFWQGWATSEPGRSAQKSDLWMVNVSGTGLQRLTTDGTSSDPEWSPDGNEIVFVDKGSIKIFDARSKKIRTLLEASVSSEPDKDSDWVVYGQPKWSPSGKAIAVVAREQHSDERKSITRVVVVTTDGWRLCQFASGVEHHQWNKEGELMLDYGKFIFDWDGFTFGKRPKPDSDETKFESTEPDDRTRKSLLKWVSSYGVIRIGDYAIAPSGNRIAFVGEFEGNTDHASQESDLWLVNPDGTGLRRLTENRDSSEPAWSPSGKEIAFVNNGDVKIIDVKTRNIRKLPDLRAYHPKPEHRTHDHWDLVHVRPRWSPNGKVIAAQLWGDLSDDGAMTAVEARSGNSIFETEADRGGSTFSWNAAAELVVGQMGKFVFDWDRTFWYGSWPRNQEPEVSEQDASATKDPLLKQLLKRLSTRGVKIIRAFFPSPSGEKLVFAGEFEETHNAGMHESDLWLVNRDGTGLRRLTKNHSGSQPAWSPSGKEIAFVNVDSISIMNIRTGRERKLPGLQAYTPPEAEGGRLSHDASSYSGPDWSPNGKAIAAGGMNGGTSWIAAVEAISGKGLFSYETNDCAWNDQSELILEGYGGEFAGSPVAKVIFDWDRITRAPLAPASGRLFLFKQDGKVGYFNSNGETKIKPQFSDAGQFSEGLAPVAFDGKWGYINKTGELMNIPRFDAALPFSGGSARVKVDGRWRLIDKRSLGDIGPAKSAITALIAALKHRHDAVRFFAAKALATIGPSALAALSEALKDENEIVRTAAAKIIGEMASKAEPAIPALVTALKGEDESASSNAAQALSRIGPSAVRVFIEALKDHHDYVRRNAARGLGRPDAAAAVPALIEALKDVDALVRQAAAGALGVIKPQVKDAAAVVPALIAAMKDSDAPVRKAAVGALHVMNPQTKEAAEALLAALNDADIATRSSAAGAIVSIIVSSPSDSPFEQVAVTALIAALRAEDNAGRDGAASLLYYAGPSIGPREKEAVPALVDAVKHRDGVIRISAFNGLARLGPAGKAALPTVIEALTDPDPGVRKAAADAFAAITPGTGEVPASPPAASSGTAGASGKSAPAGSSAPSPAGAKAHVAVIETDAGTIRVELLESEAPKTAENFRLLAERGFYNGTIFHRVISGFMIQGGDPKGDGTGGVTTTGQPLVNEINPSSPYYQGGYRRGVVAMANKGTPETGTSQFFIMHQTYPLQPNYTVFGRVIEGLEVVDRIATAPTSGSNNRPLKPVVIKKITISTASN
ncbi:MAG TPA: HEAT repeat domain-containing protein [Blastocatellia bacterium]|nr:HEAT repeat domain-containing protein [Blastocatellia bacterium]